LNNSHLKYVPRKKITFNELSGDGEMALMYESDDNKKNWKLHAWKGMMAITLPGYFYASSIFGIEYTALYPLMYFPTLFYMWVGKNARREESARIEKMWLLKNGDQIAC
jgi:hypothetical protein